MFDSTIIECSYEFWPRLDNSEPDVLLRLIDENHQQYLVCIEAKYWSDKSSDEDTTTEVEERQTWQRDQLAREIEDMHKELCHILMEIHQDKLMGTVLVYLTNDTYLHFKELKESVEHVRGIDFPINQLYWLSWKQIYNVIHTLKDFKTKQDEMLLSDLKRLLRKKGLVSFNGFHHHMKFVYPYETKYQSERTEKDLQWSELKEVNKMGWSYGGN
ncbi:hypothetical protein ACFYKX_09010 [Cytobacillus sp. FJAT-54145]|uniref:NERD domain-containing protein n=1 Tax=Cytobacillus spartinae TaxID=3299023 RepID=A0ABW6K988_9BACI